MYEYYIYIDLVFKFNSVLLVSTRKYIEYKAFIYFVSIN